MEHLDPGYILELALGALKSGANVGFTDGDGRDGDRGVAPEVVVGDLADGEARDPAQSLEASTQPAPLLLEGVAAREPQMQDEETDDHVSA